MPLLSPDRMFRLCTGSTTASPLPSLSPSLLWRTMFWQSSRLLEHKRKESGFHQKDQKRVRHSSQVSQLQQITQTSRDRNAAHLWYRRMSLVQRVSQSLSSSMLHPEPHQTGAEEKVTEIPKTQGQWFTKQPNQRKPFRLLGQRDHARHRRPRTQSRVCRHLQLRRALSFRRDHLHSGFSRLVEGTEPRFQTHCASSQLARVRFLLDLG